MLKIDNHTIHNFNMFVHRSSLLGIFEDRKAEIEKDPVIPWIQWGPDITRWFNSDSTATRWITTTAGQRCVVMMDNGSVDSHDEGSLIIVIDFNPHNVRKLAQKLKDQPGKDFRCMTEPSSTVHFGAFKEDIVSKLPCRAVGAKQLRYDGVLMDEERLIGIKVCTNRLAASVL